MCTTPIATTSVAYLRPLLRLLREREVDVPALLARHGLDAGQLSRPDARVPVQITCDMLDEAQQLTGDLQLWRSMLHYAEYSTFGGLGLVLAAGGSLRSVLRRIMRFHGVISDAIVMQMHEREDYLLLSIEACSAPVPHPQSMLFLLGVIVALGRLRLSGSLQLQQIELQQVDADTLRQAQRFFRCPVINSARWCIHLSATDADQMLDDSDVEMAAMLEQTLTARLAETHGALPVRLALWLEQHFPEGEPTLADAARALHLSQRSLQRRLQAENRCWSGLVEETRKSLVERHLRTPGMSLTQLAFLLGFADVSSFSRAFRKWYGVSASEYRTRTHQS